MNYLKENKMEKPVVKYFIYNSVNDKYKDFNSFAKTVLSVLRKHREINVNLYLDENIISHHGIIRFNEILEDIKPSRSDFNSSQAPLETDTDIIRSDALYHVIDENTNCEINTLILLTKEFYNKYTAHIKSEYNTDISEQTLSCDYENTIAQVLLSAYGTKSGSGYLAPGNNYQILMVAGFPGSGKSTVGKTIASRRKIAFIDKDTVSRKISEEAIKVIGSYEGDYETNAYGSSIRRTQYLDMGIIAAVNLSIYRPVLLTSPFTSQAKAIFEHQENNTKVEELYLNHFYDSEYDRSLLDTIELYFVWVRTSRQIEHHRIHERDAQRDFWKRSHWIRHACNQNKTSSNYHKYIFEESKYNGISIFDNEYDDDLEFGIKKVLREIDLFYNDKKNNNKCVPIAEIKTHDEPSLNSYKDIVGNRGGYFADFMYVENQSIEERENDLKNYLEITKCTNSKAINGNTDPVPYNEIFYKKDSIPFAMVVKGIEFNESVKIDTFMSKKTQFNEENFKQLIFENCTFNSTVSLKKSKYDLEFNNCTFEKPFLIFNRKDTKFSSEIEISFFGSTFLGNCTIMDTKVKNLSIVDCNFEDMNLNKVTFDNINIFNCQFSSLDVGVNCGPENTDKSDIVFFLRDCRIHDYIKLPNINFNRMDLNENMLGEIRINDVTLASLSSINLYKIESIEKSNNTNAMQRRLDTCNQLYSSLVAQNKYKEADECLKYNRRLEYLLNYRKISPSGGVKSVLKHIGLFLKYTTMHRIFGGGISIYHLILNYLVSSTIAWGFVCLFTQPHGYREVLQSLVLAALSILNIDLAFQGCPWIMDKISGANLQLEILLTCCNAYGIVLIAVLTGALVRVLIR